jgi:hypothetical protein
LKIYAAVGSPQDLADYKYWKARGWLEKDADYYCKARINPVKKALAGAIARILTREWK